MASHSLSNKSPSPLSSKHANPRNSSETNSATRRSFTGSNARPSVLTNPRRLDPNTPANSPLDFRRSVSDCDEKENEKDLNSKPLKPRPSGKGTKHFMSPTISAASKVTPSPKKKILAERNDPLRTSAFWCDGRAMFFSSTNSSQELDSSSDVLPSDQSQILENSSSLNNVSEKKEGAEAPPPVSKPPKRVSFIEVPSDSQPATESLSDSVATESHGNMKSESASSNIAPLDADPSLPPYDPKTNYLSPRPQFLYYKPNPKLEAFMNKDMGMDPDGLKGLEDRFLAEIMSETFSDSEESSQSEAGSEIEEPQVAADMVLGLMEDAGVTVTTENLVQDREMKPEIADSSDKVSRLEEADEDHGLEHVDPLPATPSVTDDDAVITEKLPQERERRPWGFSSLIRFSMILMLLIGCVSVGFNQHGSLDQIVHSGMKSFTELSSYYREFNVPAVAEESLERLARHVNELSANFIDLMSKLTKPSERKLHVPLKFINVTDLLLRNIWEERNFLNIHDGTSIVEEELTSVGHGVVAEDLDDSEEMFDSDEISSEEMGEDHKEDELENYKDTDYEVESDEVYFDEPELDTQNEAVSTDSESSLPDVSETEAVSADSVMDVESGFGSLQPEILENEAVAEDSVMDSGNSQPEVELEFETSLQSESGAVSVSNVIAEAVSNVIAEADMEVETEMVETTMSGTATEAEGDQLLTEVSESLLTSELPAGKSENKLAPYIIQASALFVVLLLPAAAFLYRQKKKTSSSAKLVNQKTNLLPSKQADSGFAMHKQYIHQEKLISQQTEVEDPFPSEISTSYRSSFYKKEELRGETEAQSVGGSKSRRYSKRESLASSAEYSTGSPSYGSFTTLERIPIKHGDDEIITPVRRSSRIRKQVTSP